MMNARITGPPEHIGPTHDTSAFDCGVEELNTWLKRRALANDAAGASRTFVVTAGDRIVGYYALATGAVSHAKSTGRVRRNMPEPIPVIVLARLGVDLKFQGTGLGASLLRDALLRILGIAQQAGVRAVLLHAVSEDAKRFYLHYGFSESPIDPMVMMVTLADLERSVGR